MAEVFISYSRKDKDFVRRLGDALVANHRETWVDWKDIPLTAEWQQEILRNIEAADNFIFIISPDSIASVNCRKEIEHAAVNNKKMLPLFYRPVPDDSIPETLSRFQRLDFGEPAEFEAKFAALVTALDTDLPWTQAHTRLLTRAKEWERMARDSSFFLHGKDLREAEQWMGKSSDSEPKPTTLQSQYIVASRQSATRIQRIIIGAVAVAFLVAVGLAIYAFLQKNVAQRETQLAQTNEAKAEKQERIAKTSEAKATQQENIAKQNEAEAVRQKGLAERERDVAESRAWAAEAQFERGRRLDRAISLSAKAVSTMPLYEALDSAISVGQAAFNVKKILRAHTQRITATCFVQGGSLLVSAAEDGRAILWDVDAGRPLQFLNSSVTDRAKAIDCSSNSRVVAVASYTNTLVLWRIDGNRATPSLKITDSVDRLKFSPNGAMLVTEYGGQVKVRSATTGAIMGKPFELKYAITALAVSDSGDLLAIGTSDRSDHGGEVSLWSGAGKNVFTDNPFPTVVKSVAILSGSGKLIGAGDDGDLRAWNLDGSKAEVHTPDNIISRQTTAVAIGVNGDIAAIAQGKEVIVEELDSQGNVQRLAGHAMPVTAVAFTPDGTLVASGSEDGIIIVHRRLRETEFNGGWVVAGPDESSEDIAFTRDGGALILDGTSKSPKRIPVPVSLLNSLTPKSRTSIDNDDRSTKSFSIVIEGDKARLRDDRQNRVVDEMIPDRGEGVIAGDASSDGKRWAAASSGVLRIGRSGERRSYLAVLPTGFGDMSAVALSPDGALIAVAGSNLLQASDSSAGMVEKMIVVIDGDTHRPLGAPLSMPDVATTLKMVFSPNGEFLATVSQSNTAVWIVGPRLWLRWACAALDVRVTSAEWQQRAPGTNYPENCITAW